MTLVGKIFTLLILIMSVAFMMLAMTIFSTHRNWRDVVLADRNATAPDKSGLKVQIEDLAATNRQLRDELQRASDVLAMEQAARRYALATLQTKLEQAEQRLQQREKEFAELQAAHGTMVTTLETNEENLKAIADEIAKLRVSKRDAEQARDDKFGRVVELTDKINELEGAKKTLEEYQGALVAQLARMKLVLDRNELTEFTDVANIPPVVDGVVTAVGGHDLIEISIGWDDGIRQGHTLEVYRDASYLGRVVIQSTEPDRAVARVLKDYRKGIIKKGDRVATKLS
ncbi:MAG: hypothetical protein ACC628_22590 [Pirellulaceae bacterium]